MDLPITAFHVEVDEDIAKRRLAPRSLEEVDRLQRGHENLDPARRVHLLANDRLRLLERPQTERQIRVGPGHELPDHSGAQHELMARHLGIGRDFLHGRNERLRPTHG